MFLATGSGCSVVKLIARWRTWIVNVGLAALIVLPDILRAPEILALFPAEYQKIIIAVVFVITNIWMRPRPAVLPSDIK